MMHGPINVRYYIRNLASFSTSKDHGQASNIKYMKANLNNLYIVVIDGKINSSTCGKYITCFDVIIRFMKLCDLFKLLYM